MAARENQGLQIALIIFVLLTIILIVSTYWVFTSYTGERDKGKALAAENQKLTTQTATANDESAACKAALGAESKDDKAAVEAKTKKAIDTYGESIPEANRNYQFLVEQLAARLKSANDRITEITTHEKELDEKIKADEVAKNAEIEKYQKQLATTAKDLEEVRKNFTVDRETMNKGKKELTDKFESKQKDFQDLTKKSSEQIAGLTAETSKMSQRLKAKNEKELAEQKANEVPDGKITRVNQVTRTVWINLGSEDNLRRQTSFSVYGADDSNPVDAERKGKIEVVRVMQSHIAEARIVEDDLSNPIMIGDPVYSPAWEPGRVEHFALAGKMDIDKDGADDRQRVRDLIALNGGAIDAEVGTDNKRSGKMSINTKFLVLGDEPSPEGKTNTYGEIRTEAQTLGVRIVSVNEFLNYMGYKSEERTVRLGKEANPADFKARLPEGVQRVRAGTTPAPDQRKKAPTSEKVTY